MSFFSSEYDSLYTHGKNQPIRMCRNKNFLTIGTRDENEKKNPMSVYFRLQQKKTTSSSSFNKLILV